MINIKREVKNFAWNENLSKRCNHPLLPQVIFQSYDINAFMHVYICHIYSAYAKYIYISHNVYSKMDPCDQVSKLYFQYRLVNKTGNDLLLVSNQRSRDA